MRTKLKTNNKFENAKLGQLTLSRGTPWPWLNEA